MPTRIFFSTGEQVTVIEEADVVAQALSSGKMAKLERPWGDSSIWVNPAVVVYIETQDERNPDIEAMEATGQAAAPAPPAAGTPPAPGESAHPQFPRG